MHKKSRNRKKRFQEDMQRKKTDNLRRIFKMTVVSEVLTPLLAVSMYMTGVLDTTWIWLLMGILLAELFQIVFGVYVCKWMKLKVKKRGLSVKPVVIYWTGFATITTLFACHLQNQTIAVVLCIGAVVTVAFLAIGSNLEGIWFGVYGTALLGMLFVRQNLSGEQFFYLFTIVVLCSVIYMRGHAAYVKKAHDQSALENATTMAETDPMTKLLNRRGLENRIINLWPVCMRESKMVSVIMLDIDNFKKYNDYFGHLQGDDCLRQISARIGECVRRKSDFAARVGGEEFLIFLYGADAKQALSWAKNLKDSVEALMIPHANENFLPFVTLSIGICSVQVERSIDFFELQNAADQALYHAKEKGKACIFMEGQCYAQTKPESGKLMYYKERGFRSL